MSNKFSAYLSIYNDWDILPAALRSIASHVDELVVVDGPYEWMVSYLAGLGLDPRRSDPRVYAALDASGIPYRVISKVWRNEPEKRQTGYEACTHRFIYRVDADEVLFFDDAELERMLSGGGAVGEMEMPSYVAPGWIIAANNNGPIGRQCLLFDREQISPEVHLNYLWLVLGVDELPSPGVRPFPIHPEPLAFNAHLTGWRTPETSVSRAAFYNLNWMRAHGTPWLPELQGRPLTDVNALFDLVPPRYFLNSLRRGRMAAGTDGLTREAIIRASPLSPEQEATFAGLYQSFLDSLTAMNAAAAHEAQPYVREMLTIFDLTTPAARNAIASDGQVVLELSAHIWSARVRLNTYSATAPHSTEEMLAFELAGRELRIALPEPPDASRQMLRQNLDFQVWLDSPSVLQTFIART